jgi:NTP pyrophosphatase (non-canonical NTP hydrolase)
MEREKFSNELSDAQLERLAVLSEELGEAQQVIGKILRHGYDSKNPLEENGPTNRAALEREIGDVFMALGMLIQADDLSYSFIVNRQDQKRKSIKQWLHHQEGA